MSIIFISYRRDDSAPYAGRLYDRLVAHFGKGEVFMDIDQIAPGEDFVEVIDRKVGACSIAVVLIGKHWLDATDAQGKRRLDDPEDFVRLEVAAALARNVRVLPVLVGGATMPRMQQLPAPLAMLSRRNAFEISDSRFHSDVDKLIATLERPADEPGSTPATGRRLVTSPKVVAIAGSALLAVGVAAVILVPAMRGGRAGAPSGAVADAPVVSNAPTPTLRNDGLGGAMTANDERLRVQGELAALPVSSARMQDYQRRANQGSAEGQYRLAVLYDCGTEKNPPLATRWYEAAATQGHVAARTALVALQAPAPAEARERELAAIRHDIACVNRLQEISKDELEKSDEQAKDAIRRIKPG